MTVQKLIDLLNQVENKELEVYTNTQIHMPPSVLEPVAIDLFSTMVLITCEEVKND